ncbi:hypothetical protein [Corynebacterium kalidii]
MSDAQVNELVRVARAAGHTQPGLQRTAYLSPRQLREASLPRLVTEMARAEHPDTTQEWRQRRRNQLGDEFDRREFPGAADAARENWEQSRYEAERARIARADAEAERVRAEQARAQAQQTGVGVDPLIAGMVTAGVGVAGLAAAAESLSPEQADAMYLSGEDELTEQWAQDMSDPTVGGEVLAPSDSGDLSVSVADSMASSPTIEPEPAAPNQAVELNTVHTPDVQTGP